VVSGNYFRWQWSAFRIAYLNSWVLHKWITTTALLLCQLVLVLHIGRPFSRSQSISENWIRNREKRIAHSYKGAIHMTIQSRLHEAKIKSWWLKSSQLAYYKILTLVSHKHLALRASSIIRATAFPKRRSSIWANNIYTFTLLLKSNDNHQPPPYHFILRIHIIQYLAFNYQTNILPRLQALSNSLRTFHQSYMIEGIYENTVQSFSGRKGRVLSWDWKVTLLR